MSIGTALFDSALVSYPLYQTSQIFSSDATDPTTALTDRIRLLRFWFVFGLLALAEDYGISTIPGYYWIFKLPIMFALYSDIHSKIVNDIALGRLCKQYISLSGRAVAWWNHQAVPQVTELDRRSGGWLSSAKSRIFGLIGLTGDANAEPKQE